MTVLVLLLHFSAMLGFMTSLSRRTEIQNEVILWKQYACLQSTFLSWLFQFLLAIMVTFLVASYIKSPLQPEGGLRILNFSRCGEIISYVLSSELSDPVAVLSWLPPSIFHGFHLHSFRYYACTNVGQILQKEVLKCQDIWLEPGSSQWGKGLLYLFFVYLSQGFSAPVLPGLPTVVSSPQCEGRILDCT